MPRDTIRTVTLACGLVLVLISLGTRVGDMHLPGDHQGYAPVQPIAYSHRLHAGELDIDCSYCHTGASMGRHAGIPAAGVCMNCHRSVTAPRADVLAEADRAKEAGEKPRLVIAPELRKLYRALGLNDDRQRDPSLQPTPIRWVRVHRVPDFVAFDHSAHIAADVACQKCHGPVESMDRVRQDSTLLMGWCVDCHRQNNATLDCGACHQ